MCKGQKQQKAIERLFLLHRWLKLQGKCIGARVRGTLHPQPAELSSTLHKGAWEKESSGLGQSIIAQNGFTVPKLPMEQLVIFAVFPYCEAENTSLLPAVFQGNLSVGCWHCIWALLYQFAWVFSRIKRGKAKWDKGPEKQKDLWEFQIKRKLGEEKDGKRKKRNLSWNLIHHTTFQLKL